MEALVNQHYSPIHIIVVDANTHNSEYSFGLQEDIAKYKDVDYIQFDESFSIIQMYNYFVEEIKDGYIAFLSSSDIWDEMASFFIINQFEDKVGAVFFDEDLKEKDGKDYLWKILTLKVRASSHVIYDIQALKKINGFREGYNNYYDTDALLRISEKYKVKYLPLRLSLSSTNRYEEFYSIKTLEDYKKLHLDYIEMFVANKNLNKDYYNTIIKLAAKNYLWFDYILYMATYLFKYPVESIRNCIRLSTKGIIKLYNLLIKKTLIINSLIGIAINKFKTLRNNYIIMAEDKIVKAEVNNETIVNRFIIPSDVRIIKTGEFFNNKDIEILEIPSSIIEIQNHAFNGCTNLREVVIHDGSQLEKIGSYAFANCKKLMQVNFPTSLKMISEYSFAMCISLESIEFKDRSHLVEIKASAFIGCINMKSFIFTGRINKVGSYAFAGCKKLKSAIFSQIDSLYSLGKGAFMNCSKLPYFQLSTAMEEINAKSFYGCKSLKNIKIPKKVLYIHEKAFKSCDSLSKANILTKDIIISSNAFDNHTEIEKIDI